MLCGGMLRKFRQGPRDLERKPGSGPDLWRNLPRAWRGVSATIRRPKEFQTARVIYRLPGTNILNPRDVTAQEITEFSEFLTSQENKGGALVANRVCDATD